jgi:hypothetical protein
MGKIVLGLGASHTPLLTLTVEQWEHRAAVDYANIELNMSDGRLLTYEQVLRELGPRAADVISLDILGAKERSCDAALSRLADELAAVAPDVVIIVGDDQRELFTATNQPALAIFHGEEIATSDKYGREGAAEWIKAMGRGYLMDDVHVMAGAPKVALELIAGLMDEGFDMAACSRVENPQVAGFGHAYGFIVKRLFRVPLLVNTYYGPNVPSAARCHDLGRALRRVVEKSPTELRIAVVASGGLSHFVVDEELDSTIIDAFVTGDHSALRSIPRGALNSGSSEILNWVVAAGVVEGLPLHWHEYQALYRTAAGTGVGAAFAVWRDA